ncbi:ABC transporter ATP-binding protein [Brevibacterium album]|uniref:ABC transporter ATP-binding protein n=1 Tax=Brevibacterium album TaxID=417948 RepID=UPI0003F5B6C5|nr:ABC transporter ATP-binding protein [Brevibacterium album]
MSAPAPAPSPGARGPDTAAALLRVNNIEVIYDEVILVLRGLSLEVPEGSIVALLGSNGAGKSTTLKAISGLLPSEQGEVTSGSVVFEGQDITRMDAPERVRRGLSLCMEGRHVFPHLSVADNLLAGGYTRPREAGETLGFVYEFFPKLAEMRGRTAGFLSGGEQQMLAIGRALMAGPKLLMLDEPSLGLAPLLVEEIFETISRLNAETGLTVLVIEQNARTALSVAHHGYIMEQGRIMLEDSAGALADNPDVKEFYLGIGGGDSEKKSYRDVKHYKRRKRWL